MKKLLFICCLFGCHLVWGQAPYPIKEITDSIYFRISMSGGRMVMNTLGKTTLFESRKDFPDIQQVYLQDADLVLAYSIRSSTDLLKFPMQLWVKTGDGMLLEPAPDEKIDSVLTTTLHHLVWTDWSESMLAEFERPCTLYVKRIMMGAVNCDGKRPVFTFKKTMPYNYLGLAGLACIGAGIGIARQSDRDYQQYRTLWANGEPDPTDQQNPAYNDLLHKAKVKNKRANAFFVSGAALLAGNGLLVWLAGRNIHRKQKLYDKFCVPEKRNSWFFSPAREGFGIAVHF